MATLIPRREYSSEELRRLYPSSLELKHVQVFHRHGERTPTSDRFQHLGLPAYWPFCNAAKRLTSAILNPADGNVFSQDTKTWSNLTWKRKLETLGSNDAQITAVGAGGKTDGMCMTGELTDLGRETTLALGQRLRRLYIEQLGFMPDKLLEASPLYMRSTHMSRALESLQQVFTGLYPVSQRDPSLQMTISMRRWADDQLYPNNGSCKRFDMLFKAFSERAAAVWNNSPEMDYINDKLQQHMPSKRRIAVDGHPAIVGITDTNNARRAHSPAVSLPKEFDDEQVLANMDKIGVNEWFRGYAQNREYRMVGIGGLIGDILENITKHIDNTNRATNQAENWKLALNGCHDTTLGAIMSSLGLFNDEPWPSFTAHIAIETFRRKDTPGSSSSSTSKGFFANLFAGTHAPIGRTPYSELSTKQKQSLEDWYVRIRYNDRVYTIPGCKAQGKHLDGDESFCTLAAFKEIADKFVPKDWKKACNANLDKGVLEEEEVEAGN